MKTFLMIISLVLMTIATVNPSMAHNSHVEIYAVPVVAGNLKSESDLLNGSYQGSGTIIDKTGVVLTAYHVIERGSIWVVRYDNKLYYAEPIPRKNSRKFDMALIKIKYKIGKRYAFG